MQGPLDASQQGTLINPNLIVFSAKLYFIKSALWFLHSGPARFLLQEGQTIHTCLNTISLSKLW